ncbi:MAG: hypothetical protein P8J87_05690 [Verrucomicrobiales bacterium]|nr:hypothetical protein [Verrucomicrobiales bacterium]
MDQLGNMNLTPVEHSPTEQTLLDVFAIGMPLSPVALTPSHFQSDQ